MTPKQKAAVKYNIKQKYLHGEITLDQYDSMVDQLQNLAKAGATLQEANEQLGMYSEKTTKAAKSAAKPMTTDEMFDVGEKLAEKYKAGDLTWEEYQHLTDVVVQKKGEGASLKDVQAAVGLDPGTQAADKAVQTVEKRIGSVYKEAQGEMQEKLQKLQDEYGHKLAVKHQQLMNGEITQTEYDAWVKNYMMQESTLKKQIDQCAGVMLHANEKAVAIVNGETMNVFAENANYQSYQITQDTGMNISFAVYDEKTVERLIKERPELLPRKVVDGKKDKAWNQTKIANSITQSIIHGEDISQAAKRIAKETASMNGSAMVRYARTAMTSAQNAGRMEGLHRAQAMGIKCKKRWLATLDSRTRDAHADLDGQVVDVDEPFQSELGPIMYPGDPSAAPGNVYNCRCTLVYEYEGYPSDPTADERRDNETGELITNMDYKEWKAAKENSELNNLNAAKVELAEAQKALIKGNVDESKVYSNIWKDDVTLADYEDKKGSIQAKKDYYETEIQKLKDAQANGESWATDAKIKEKETQLKLLKEFEKKGKLLEAKTKAQANLQDVYGKIGLQKTATAPKVSNTAQKTVRTAGEKKTPFSPDAYTKERKDKALWSSDKKYVDSLMRGPTGEAWNKGTTKEHQAIVEYTASYSKFNEPLRGIEYGTNRYLGVGNTDLNAGYKNNGSALNAMTDMIDKCSYPHDMWLQRGCGYGGMDKFFQCSQDLLRNGSQKELEQALLGTTPTEYGFMSMGSAKGQGFSGNILMNVYAPAGTKMMYAEPFSHYGGHDYNWDGKSTQSHFGSEFETIMQQGTQFRVTKVERHGRSGTIYVDLEVINQDHQQRWKK